MALMGAMQVVWNGLDAASWHRLLPPEAALQQAWRYGEAAQRLGRSVHRAVLADGEGPLALAQIVGRGRLCPRLLLSRGPVWLRPAGAPLRRAALRALVRTAPPPGPRLLIVTPEAGDDGAGAGVPLLTGPTVAALPLDADPEALRRRQAQKWRNRLSRAERAGIALGWLAPTPARLDALLARDAEMRRARGYAGPGAAFLRAWRQTGRDSGLALLVAGPERRALAAMLFLLWPGGASYHLGWTSPEGRRVSAHHLMLWAAACRFAAEGRRLLDLGVIDTERAPGLARFKLGSGAVPRRLGSTALLFGSGAAAAAPGRSQPEQLAPPSTQKVAQWGWLSGTGRSASASVAPSSKRGS